VRVYLEPAEVTLLEEEASNLSDRILIHIRFHLGCRVSEALAVTVDDRIVAMLQDYIRRGGPVSPSGKRLIFGINRHRAWQIVRYCARKGGSRELMNLILVGHEVLPQVSG